MYGSPHNGGHSAQGDLSCAVPGDHSRSIDGLQRESCCDSTARDGPFEQKTNLCAPFRLGRPATFEGTTLYGHRPVAYFMCGRTEADTAIAIGTRPR